MSADMWRQQYERERVRLGYVLGWLTPDSFDGDESKQHSYIAHMGTAAAVRSRIEGLKADLRDARAALDSDPDLAERLAERTRRIRADE